jgi:hypothetical protein
VFLTDFGIPSKVHLDEPTGLTVSQQVMDLVPRMNGEWKEPRSVLATKSNFVETPLLPFLKDLPHKVPAVLGIAQYDKWQEEKFAPVDEIRPPPEIEALIQKPELVRDVIFPDLGRWVYQELTFEEAVFGSDKCPKMELSSSPGYRWKEKGCKTRRDVVEHHLDQLRENVMNILARRSQGIIVPQVVTNQLKDELLAEEKVLAGKARVFYVGDIEDFIADKMVLGALLCKLESHYLGGSESVGVVAQRYDWSFLQRELYQNGPDRIAGGDVSGLDVSMQRFYSKLAAEVVITIGGGKSEEVKNRIRSTFEGTMYAYHVTRFGTYQDTLGNPSGWLGTCFINSICVGASILAAFMEKFPHLEFQLYVKLRVYSDDNLFTVRRGIDFGNLDVATYFSKCGLKYTDPTKGKPVTQFLEPEGIVFLQRTFHDKEGFITAPLKIESVLSCLCYTPKDRVTATGEMISSLEVLRQNLDTAVRELAMYPREDANYYYGRIMEACREAQFPMSVLTLESEWRKYMQKYTQTFKIDGEHYWDSTYIDDL